MAAPVCTACGRMRAATRLGITLCARCAGLVEAARFEEMIHAAEWPDRIAPALADTEAQP